MSGNHGNRIFIWSMMRSVSTAFMRCFMNLGTKNKAVLEPYWKSYYYGPERGSTRYDGSIDVMPNATFNDVKSYLEEPFDGYDYVVVKDLGFYMKNRTHLPESLPDGYTYMFLIRHPAKSITSLYKLVQSGEMEGWTEFHPEETSYKELPELYLLISKKMGVAPVVVDADDLLEKPEEMLREVCRRSGIPFCDAMLDWKPMPDENLQLFKDWMPFMRNMLESKCLEQKPPSPPPDVSHLPEEVQKAISQAMPYYQELHRLRLTL